MGVEQGKRHDAALVFCDGVIIALVAITPAAGYVPVKYSPFFGFIAALSAEIAKTVLRALQETLTSPLGQIFTLAYDPFWIGVIHAGGGLIGMFFTAVFTRPEVYALDGYSLPPPDIDDLNALIRNQVKDALAGWLYSFIVTFFLMILVDIPLIAVKGIGGTVQERRHAVELRDIQKNQDDPEDSDNHFRRDGHDHGGDDPVGPVITAA